MSLLTDMASRGVVTTTTYNISKQDLIDKIKSEITDPNVNVVIEFNVSQPYNDDRWGSSELAEFTGITVTIKKTT